jgi:photosystem II stability/assembly factor-like uncharacterized protein
MIRRGVVWLVLFLIVLAGCRSGGPENGTPHAAISPATASPFLPGTPDPLASWVQYINPRQRFSLRHPSDLQVLAEDPSGSIGWIGPRIQYAITTSNPLDCRGDCPEVDSVDANAQVAGRTATRFFGSVGSIGGRTPQQYLSYTFWIDDQYYTFTVFALKNGEAKDQVDIIWPLAEEDQRLFEQIVSTLEFGEVNAAAPTSGPATIPGTPAGAKAPPGSMAHLRPGTPLTMKNITMIDALNGWGIGGLKDNDEHILRTQDGGATWLDVTPAEQAGPAGAKRKQALGFFRGSQRAWVAYWGGNPAPAAPRMWFTTDSGVTWTASSPLDGSGMGQDYTPEYLDFPDSVHGWLMVANSPAGDRLPASLFHSEDGGLHWARIFDPFQAQGSDLHTCCRVGMLFFDAYTGLIAHRNASNSQLQLYWSRDSGQSWWPQELPPADPVLFGRATCSLAGLGLQAPNNPAVAVACRDPSAPANPIQAFFYATQDGGQSWSSQPLSSPTGEEPPGQPTSQDIQLVFISPDNGWAALHIGYANSTGGQPESRTFLYQTADGGKTWEPRATLYWSGQFSFVTSLVGWAVATSDDQVALVKTTDEGQTWRVLEPKMGPQR